MNLTDPALNPGLDYESLRQDVERRYCLSLGQDHEHPAHRTKWLVFK